MNKISAYQDHAVSTQTRGRLIVLLYEGALKFLRQAIGALEEGNLPEKGHYIGRAQAIISELNSNLNTEAGGEIAENLRSLYNFMSRQLNEANTKRDPQRIRDVIVCLEDLLEGWRVVTS